VKRGGNLHGVRKRKSCCRFLKRVIITHVGSKRGGKRTILPIKEKKQRERKGAFKKGAGVGRGRKLV